MRNIKKITKVGSIAEIRECPKTRSKSLHTTVEFKYGQVISPFAPKKVLNHPNYINRPNERSSAYDAQSRIFAIHQS